MTSRSFHIALVLAYLSMLSTFSRAAEPAPAAEYQAMCKEIETSMTTSEGEAFDRYFNLEPLLDDVTADLQGEFKDGFKNGLLRSMKLGKQMREALGPQGHYKLLRLHSVNGAPRALFRSVGQQGLNYHDLVLARDKQQKPCFTDFYAYASGELMSDTLKHMTAQINPPKPGQPMDPEMAALVRLGELRQMVAANRGREAVELLNSMPQKTQQLKIMQLIRVMASMQVDEATYMQALESYRKLFADDPSADLVSLDIHLLKKNYDQLFASIDRLDKALGGDPYLDTMRSSAYLEKGDLPNARKLAEKALAADAKMFEAHDSLLTVAIKQKDHATTVKELDQMEADFGMKWKDLRQVPMFADFVNSPQYQEWAKRHPGS